MKEINLKKKVVREFNEFDLVGNGLACWKVLTASHKFAEEIIRFAATFKIRETLVAHRFERRGKLGKVDPFDGGLIFFHGGDTPENGGEYNHRGGG